MSLRSAPLALGWFAALALGLIVAAGCGGGATSSPAPPPAPQQTAVVTFSIQLGGSQQEKGRLHPSYLSKGTASIAIAPVVLGQPPSSPQVSNLANGDPGCSGSRPNLTCTVKVTAPVGQTPFDIATFGQANAKGNPLSVGSIVVDVQPAGSQDVLNNAISLTLDPVVSSFSLDVIPTQLEAGKNATVNVSVTAKDASGAIIIGPGQYTTPIEVAQPLDLSGNPFFGQPPSFQREANCQFVNVPNTGYCFLVATPGQTFPFTYGGELGTGLPIQFAAATVTLPTQVVPMAIATPKGHACTGKPIKVCPGTIQFADPLSSPVPLTVTEPGVSTFTVDATVCAQSVGEQVADVNGGPVAFGDLFTIYPLVDAGSCQITVHDESNHQTTLNIALLSSGTPSPVPSATPTASPSPTPLPTGPIIIKPSNMLEFASATAAPQQFTASEPGFSSFTVDESACTGAASVSPLQGSTFTVTPDAADTNGSICLLQVSDSAGHKDPVQITVDGVTIIIQSKSRP